MFESSLSPTFVDNVKIRDLSGMDFFYFLDYLNDGKIYLKIGELRLGVFNY